MNRRLLVSSMLALSVALAATACGKKEGEKKADQPANAPAAEAPKAVPAAEAVSPTAAAAAEVAAPPPNLGMPFETFHSARLLQTCALKYGVAEKTAERMAIELTKGKKPELHLDAVFQKPDAKVKPAAEPKDDHAFEIEREKWRDVVKLADAHTATVARLKDETETCLYAPEAGLIEGKTIETYVKIFVEVTCAQKAAAKAGNVDELARAQAAVKVFQENGMSAGEFSRYGVIFGRFPVVIQQAYTARAQKCPDADPPPSAAPSPAGAVYNGVISGDRNGSVRLEDRAGKLNGAVQWAGVAAAAPDGRPQPPAIIPINGAITGTSFTVSGELHGESFKLSGKLDGNGLTGTWNGTRASGKSKGDFKGEKLAMAPTNTPAAEPAAAPAAPAAAPK